MQHYSVFYLKEKLLTLYVVLKFFIKKIGLNIKKDISKWGAKDLWGDFDLLIGAYKNNLKIIEVPVTYFERKENETKMNSLFLMQQECYILF